MQNIGIIIQARTGSKRLPNKMVIPFYKEYSILDMLLMRLVIFFKDIPIIVATSTNTLDDKIELIARKHDVNFFRGNEEDVLVRFVETAKKYDISKVIRICADNPFLDMLSLKQLIDEFVVNSYDYLSFSTSDGIPTIKTHYGFWAEAVTIEALMQVSKLTDENLYHEHVTNYIYTYFGKFNIRFLTIPSFIEQNKAIRLTIDTQEDFDMQQNIFSIVYNKNKQFSMTDVIKVLDEIPIYYKKMHSQILKNSK